MENHLVNPSVFENIKWLQDQLEEQESLLRLRVCWLTENFEEELEN